MDAIIRYSVPTYIWDMYETIRSITEGLSAIEDPVLLDHHIVVEALARLFDAEARHSDKHAWLEAEESILYLIDPWPPAVLSCPAPAADCAHLFGSPVDYVVDEQARDAIVAHIHAVLTA